MIPRNCMPVVRILRRDVKRPKLKDLYYNDILEFPRFKDGKCPMGLHEKSVDDQPTCASDFGNLCTGKQVISFLVWWDKLNLTQAKQAVREIWSKDKCK